jgi:hypothetical protein
MKFDRATHDPSELLAFYEEALTAQGALCERTWYDRLEVIAEGPVAALWNAGESLHEVELRFVPPDAATARDATREVFPGCPLTFHLTEALRSPALTLERYFLASDTSSRPPEAAVVEKRWRAQFSDTSPWQLKTPLTPAHHFSLVSVVRCEIQAIDQHWSLHRAVMSLPGGEIDDDLARELDFQQSGGGQSSGDIAWPNPDPAAWNAILQKALAKELDDDLVRVRSRQENSLRRELERIDDYFGNYRRELISRAPRAGAEAARIKTAERLAASEAEHNRRRADQIARHAIRIVPHIDALLLIAEPAWRGEVNVHRSRRAETIPAHFIPRSRRWEIESRDGASPGGITSAKM